MLLPVTVPGLLADSLGGERRTLIEARTLAEALRSLRQKFPSLAVHVWDERLEIRRHVLVYLNDQSVKWIDDHEARLLRDGDQLAIIQAVSGG